MDIGDLEGDRDAGIRTLPVLLGRETSLTLASLLLTAGVGGAGMGILSSGVSRHLSKRSTPKRGINGEVGGGGAGKMCRQMQQGPTTYM